MDEFLNYERYGADGVRRRALLALDPNPRGRRSIHVQFVQSTQDILHHAE
jgi:hypothetical protein